MMSLHFVFSPGLFVLGIAVGVLGLVLLLSLIVSYAYEERTLLALAVYLSLMVGAIGLGQRLQMGQQLVQNLLLVSGPALMAAFQMWVMRNRQSTGLAKTASAIVVLATLALLGLQSAWAPADVVPLAIPAALVWALLLLVLSVTLLWQSWDTVGPWKWWLLLGHWGGLAVSALFLTHVVDAQQSDWAVVMMLLLQIPPVYLSLVWRSRLLNESRLRSYSASTTDPLTGLATVNVLLERLMRVTSRAPQSNTTNALFAIDVMNWQGLLNELGAEFNEKMLLEAAMRLRRSIGDNDLAARLSGGRFAVVAQGLKGDEDISALATRLVVSGLRIDSPLLSGVEFKFRVIVMELRLKEPLTLLAAQAWMQSLTGVFARWPSSHRSRSILVVSEDLMSHENDTQIDSDY